MDQAKATGEGWQLALPVNAQLGEGLHWDAARLCLWMVDIHGRRLLRWTLDAPRWTEWAMPERLGWVMAPAGTDQLLLGLQSGIARVSADQPTAAPEWLARPFEGRPWMRLNDAKQDSHGAVWAGSLNNDDESQPDGCLYRLAPDGHCSVVDSGYAVTNGPVIDERRGRLLHTDSVHRVIYSFALDMASGQLGPRQVWRQFSDAEGHPDGMCLDAEGGLWVAHWGAACISRFDAEGQLLRRVSLPAAHITNVCFAGPGLSRLFVSSAQAGLSPDQLQAQPLAGHLFEVDPQGLTGQPVGPGLSAA